MLLTVLFSVNCTYYRDKNKEKICRALHNSKTRRGLWLSDLFSNLNLLRKTSQRNPKLWLFLLKREQFILVQKRLPSLLHLMFFNWTRSTYAYLPQNRCYKIFAHVKIEQMLALELLSNRLPIISNITYLDTSRLVHEFTWALKTMSKHSLDTLMGTWLWIGA